jgi:hypothetical protein
MRLTGERYTAAARADARRPMKPEAVSAASALGVWPPSPRAVAVVLALGREHPRDTVRPERRDPQGAGRCPGGACESVERVLKAANPEMFMDLADSALMTCYHCGEGVCCGCQTAPVEFAGSCMLCPRCGQD